MAWSAPITAVANGQYSDAQYNTYIRDNLLTTAPALATASGQYFVTDAVNKIEARSIGSHTVATSQTTTSTTYADLATVGPTVTTIDQGNDVVVFFAAEMSNGTANFTSSASVAVSNGSYVPASDGWRIATDGRFAASTSRVFSFHRFTGLDEGPKTFTMQYRVGGGTGTFLNRYLAVMPL